MTTTPWLQAERASLAAEQILDAAGDLFAQQGVAAVAMADVADAAGCSRATLYRYFDSRDALRAAYVHREARRIGVVVAEGLGEVDDPRGQLVQAMADSLRLVRQDTTLAAWFTVGDAGATARLAQSSAVIETLVAQFLGDRADPATRRRARWVVRVLVSLLAQPEADVDEERAVLEEFVAPVVAGRAEGSSRPGAVTDDDVTGHSSSRRPSPRSACPDALSRRGARRRRFGLP